MVRRVAFVVTDFPALSETFIINQINAVIEEGFDVDILCLGNVNSQVHHKSVEKHNLINKILGTPRLPANVFIRLFWAPLLFIKNLRFAGLITTAFNPKKYGREAIDLQQFYRLLGGIELLKKDYKAVHVHFGQNGVYLLFILKRLAVKSKIVISFHGFDAHDFSRKFYNELTRQEFLITSNTGYTARALVALGFRDSHIKILPETLDTLTFTPSVSDAKQIHNSTIRIIFVGRLVEWKAPHLVIEIIHQVVAKGYAVNCTIIGYGYLWEHCNQLIERYNLTSVIEMKGAQTQEQIMELMERSDIFLYPGIVDKDGRCENQGLVIQEAQAMQLPVIVSDVGGMSEGVVDNKNGFLIEQKNITGFVKSVIQLIEDPILRKFMGQEGRNSVVDNYDSKKVAHRLIAYYES